MEPIQLTLTNGVWFMDMEVPADASPEEAGDRFAEFALAVYERHGLDVFGLGLVTLN